MQIYTSEYLETIEDIEEKVEKGLVKLTDKLNNDSMIECRNLSIGDLLFDYDEYLKFNSLTLGVNIYQELSSLTGGRKTKEQITDSIIKVTEQAVMKFIEEEISKSEIVITNLNDIRKIIKIVFDGDVIIDHKE